MIRCVHQGTKEDVDIETYDIYLLPPNEDPETCASWLRMRNRDGRYQLFFEEWVVEGDFIITPRISFEASSPPSLPARSQLAAGWAPRICNNTARVLLCHRACVAAPGMLLPRLWPYTAVLACRSACASWAASWHWVTRSAAS